MIAWFWLIPVVFFGFGTGLLIGYLQRRNRPQSIGERLNIYRHDAIRDAIAQRNLAYELRLRREYAEIGSRYTGAG